MAVARHTVRVKWQRSMEHVYNMGPLYMKRNAWHALCIELLGVLYLRTSPCSVSHSLTPKSHPRRQAIGVQSTKLQCVTHSPLCSAHSEPRRTTRSEVAAAQAQSQLRYA